MTEELPDIISLHITWQDFIDKSPPGRAYLVGNAISKIYTNAFTVSDSDIFTYCDECKGDRYHNLIELSSGNQRGMHHLQGEDIINLTYICKNCDKYKQTHTIKFVKYSKELSKIIKISQYPPFGPPVPLRVISLVGPDRELFLKGRRAENQGLGIAAFAYYRRIVENQWQRFLDEIIKVGKKTGLDSITLRHIEDAKKERQFSKAVENMGDAIPPVLKLNGQNPITLLYSALSEGIHEKSDEDCLELAGHIRIIIYELAERLTTALQEHNELDTAVKRLASRKNPVAKSVENI